MRRIMRMELRNRAETKSNEARSVDPHAIPNWKSQAQLGPGGVEVSASQSKPQLLGHAAMQTMYSSDGLDCYSWRSCGAEAVVSSFRSPPPRRPACGPLIDSWRSMLESPRTRGKHVEESGTLGKSISSLTHTWESYSPQCGDDHLPASPLIITLIKKMKKTGIILLALLCATFHLAISFTPDGLVPNGNFELGPKPNQMKGTRVVDPHAIPNWEISGFVEYIKSGQKQGDMLLVVPEGIYAVRLGEDAWIKTTVKAVKGTYYSLSFTFARTCAQEERLKVSVSPNSKPNDWGMLPLQTMYSSDGWDSYCWAFLAEAEVVDIVIHNPAAEKDPACGPLIDSVALKALNPPRRRRGNMLKNGNFEEVGGRESALAQVVRTRPGKVYDLYFSVGDANNACEGSMVVEAFAGKLTLQVPFQSKGKGGSVKAKHRFTAISTRTRVRFLSSFYHMKSDNSGSLCGPVIDDVRLVSVRNPRIP
nr:uncharacterized protein LOC107021632 [Ipomoea batatas]